MLKVLIADDEPLAVKLLQKLLLDIEDIELVCCCQNGQQVVDFCLNNPVDLIFIDIEMPVMNGFEVIKALPSSQLPLIVFVTAFDRYAIEAFDLHAVDYLLKPFDAERLNRAILRASNRLSEPTQMDHNHLLGVIEDITSKVTADLEQVESSNISNKLTVKDGSEISIIPYEDILWIEAAGDYMCVHTEHKNYIIRVTLKQLIDTLDGSFKRIHRSTIVNIHHIHKISNLPKGERLLHLGHNIELKVSRNFRDQIINILN